ncbi:type I-C CRISPR-associated protein Cas7/Csd2 [Porphyromonas circumdentaria]|uniref:CRISPR-associated protein, Csd2 family n=1 Tax=Porphyromonas circumdentaria TaxID=29524 RepID=A0A1T4NSI2_9PORP|nr:type I-C CRISPR-associated protein Cas7/Csd2 [Porphyromonas circumdentaria]MBB6276182.1 CRISPR-associated protein Csd2 [Porphyromonas circumdentaria]MDO4722331.1 type I-C CRISPR-associated protein Cas7/Csd2 [Porphyromonas circumdentaria]SJZ82259.1 CRISPR-associated protein, Csd2 family [Porphyromonas circumdentaria]
MNQEVIKNRYEFVLLFDVVDGNPNGDPDGANAPRSDSETGHGLVTDVCIKRKIRNYIELLTQERPELKETHQLFIRQGSLLNETLKENAKLVESQPEGKKLKGEEKEQANREAMCKHYYDVRTFGAVMSTGENSAKAGQVRGAVQLTFSRSIDPIYEEEHSITRMAKTDKKDAEKKENENDTNKENENAQGPNQAMGTKHTISYALYRCHGFITPYCAETTGFSEGDLELLWEAIENMFEIDRSASRGLMSARKLIIFKHESKLGNAPAHRLFDLIQIKRKKTDGVARSFDDYEILIDKSACPNNVELIEKF